MTKKTKAPAAPISLDAELIADLDIAGDATAIKGGASKTRVAGEKAGGGAGPVLEAC